MSIPAIYAHRGASAHAPENTLSSFNLAVKQNADGIEFDVKLTRDGKVIVLHDMTLDRTTTGKGAYKNYSFEELRKFDAGSWFSSDFSGEKLPLLEEVFDAVGSKLAINIELTNYNSIGDGLVEAVSRLVNALKDSSRVMFSSFSARNLRKAKFLCPKIPCGLLTMPGITGWWAREITVRSDVYDALHPYYRDVHPGLLKKVHQMNKQLNVWTVNDPDEIKRLGGMGVNMIMTDDPALAKATLISAK